MLSPAVALPLGALVAGLALVAVPVLILVFVWAAVTTLRILLPERPLPFEPVERRRRATLRGESVPVRLRDILEDQARRRTAARGQADELEANESEPAASPMHPLFDDLWLRRN